MGWGGGVGGGGGGGRLAAGGGGGGASGSSHTGLLRGPIWTMKETRCGEFQATVALPISAPVKKVVTVSLSAAHFRLTL